MSRRFPIDCPIDCEFHKMWDLSIDDYTHVCTKLGKQIDECDYGYGIFLLCPIESEDKHCGNCKYCGEVLKDNLHSCNNDKSIFKACLETATGCERFEPQESEEV